MRQIWGRFFDGAYSVLDFLLVCGAWMMGLICLANYLWGPSATVLKSVSLGQVPTVGVFSAEGLNLVSPPVTDRQEGEYPLPKKARDSPKQDIWVREEGPDELRPTREAA